jgi:L-2-hydroxyglutarate oxidase LhgO
LFEQGKANDVEVELVDKKRMKEIEPMARANEHFKFALFSPNSAVSCISGVLDSIRKELADRENVEINTGTQFIKLAGMYGNSDQLLTNRGLIDAKVVINVAGHDCVRIAQEFGLA